MSNEPQTKYVGSHETYWLLFVNNKQQISYG